MSSKFAVAAIVAALVFIEPSVAARVCGNRLLDNVCDLQKSIYSCNLAALRLNCRKACNQCESSDIMPAQASGSCVDVFLPYACTLHGDVYGCGTAIALMNCQRTCNLCGGGGGAGGGVVEREKIVERIVEVTRAPVVETTTSAAFVE